MQEIIPMVKDNDIKEVLEGAGGSVKHGLTTDAVVKPVPQCGLRRN